MPLVTVCMQAYNTERFLPQCMESVLSQTLQDFEFLIIDNGSTDGSKEILRKYAESDSRICLMRREQNKNSPLYMKVAQDFGTGEYFTAIDSDDWWEPDYLEKLLEFAKSHDLDIACTGTVMHHMATGGQSLRKVDQRIILPKESFADRLPWYHVFFRPVWGKLVRMNCIKPVPLDVVPKLTYGADTLWCFQMLRRASRMGIDTTVLHHYRIHKSSVSYQYDPDRFKADVYLYNDAIDFLSAFGPVSAQNSQFLQIVYSNALSDTINVIHNSSLAPEDKLREYNTIVAHPLTQTTYRECRDESTSRSKKALLCGALQAGAALAKQENQDFRDVARVLVPRCGQAVTPANAKLFLEDTKLLQTLLQDDSETLLRDLLTRIEKNQFVKKYPLPETVQALVSGNPLLCQVNDTVFMRKYARIYLMVWQGETFNALEEMTGLLLEDRISGGQETFLQLYISLSAVLEESTAFVYGKLKMAQLYFRQNRLPECRAIVTELEEMGLLDNEELESLRHDLERSDVK